MTDDAIVREIVCAQDPRWERLLPTQRATWLQNVSSGTRAYKVGMAAIVAERARIMEQVVKPLVELAEGLIKRDNGGECDHSRRSCEDVGCMGDLVEAARAALAKAREKMGER